MKNPRLSNRAVGSLHAGLLILRLGMGLSLFFVFGIPKVHDAWAYAHTGQWRFVDFNRKVGLPLPVVAAVLQTLNESVGALCLAAGFLGRVAALTLAAGFGVATFCSLKAGEAAWLTAAYFTLIFTTLLLTPGNFSLDYLLRSKKLTGIEENGLTK